MNHPRLVDFLCARFGAQWTVVSRRTGRWPGEITRKQYRTAVAEYTAAHGEPY